MVDHKSRSANSPRRERTVFQQAKSTKDLPYVVYECGLSFDVTSVTSNCRQVLGLTPEELIGTRAFSEQRVFPADIEYISERAQSLVRSDSISMVHRVMDSHGLPIWVTHSLQRCDSRGGQFFRGYLLPLPDYDRIRNVDSQALARFIHKVGNHLQLLSLVSNSMSKEIQTSRDLETLQEVVEKLIDLTRTLSDYSQDLSGLSDIYLEDLCQNSSNAQMSLFAGKDIALDIAITKAACGVVLQGDAAMLDTAVTNIIKNAFEATEQNGRIRVAVEALAGHGKKSTIVQIRVTDYGCGIPEVNLPRVLDPFFTTKKDHDGLGLSIASKFVEMHGGILTVASCLGRGTEAIITLPVEHASVPPECVTT